MAINGSAQDSTTADFSPIDIIFLTIVYIDEICHPIDSINDEIEYVHRISRMTDSVDRSYFGSKRPY